MYNKDGARLFQSGETIPSGYVDCPSKVNETPKEEVKKPVKKAKK